jgi:NAD(P)H-hydrate epimerase
MGGLVATASKQQLSIEEMVQSAAWWHAQAGVLAAKERTELGVDAYTLTQYLMAVVHRAYGTAIATGF